MLSKLKEPFLRESDLRQACQAKEAHDNVDADEKRWKQVKGF